MRIYPCKECAAKRKQLKDHIKRAELAKAAKAAAEGAAMMATKAVDKARGKKLPSRMKRAYEFARNSIESGRTVLIYKGVTAKTAKHVKDVDMLEMRGDVMYCDGVSCKGLTICLKPVGYRNER